ncbi:hypothetical protein V7S43_018393 [Phytophthora oleae]|uniref:Uncharacterized protein n=1 Tax=Phytophthora oleae TaxID=2107226 RepID=A0ABD3ERB1_9STRA
MMIRGQIILWYWALLMNDEDYGKVTENSKFRHVLLDFRQIKDNQQQQLNDEYLYVSCEISSPGKFVVKLSD